MLQCTLLHASDTLPLAQGRQDIDISPLRLFSYDNLDGNDNAEDEWEDMSDDDIIGQ